MTEAPKKVIKVPVEVRPLVDRLCVTDDPAEIKKIATKLRRLVRGGRTIKRLRLDLVPPRTRPEVIDWVEAGYRRKLRQLGRKRLPRSEKRRVITALLAEAKRLYREYHREQGNNAPNLELSVDDCMRKHRRRDTT
jgi:hypothetical protein